MNMFWTIRRSFRAYVESAGGDVSVQHPAESDGEGFAFPGVVEGENWHFSGAVTFRAHGGMLAVTLAEPAIEWSGLTGELSAATALDGSGPRTVLARVSAATAAHRMDLEPRLTVLGARLFGDVYPPGDALDRLRIDPRGQDNAGH